MIFENLLIIGLGFGLYGLLLLIASTGPKPPDDE